MRRARIKEVPNLPVRRKIVTKLPTNATAVEPQSHETNSLKNTSPKNESEKRSYGAVDIMSPTPKPKSSQVQEITTQIISSENAESQKLSPENVCLPPGSSQIAHKINNYVPNHVLESENTLEVQLSCNTEKSLPEESENLILKSFDKETNNIRKSSSICSALDGIVPLTETIEKPSEASVRISENVELLFDPIVPLPSPTKVRPKLRPVPRLGPHRRSSIQGSASESEDESRRSILQLGGTKQRTESHPTSLNLNRDVNRVRNDSVNSTVTTSGTTPHPVALSPIKDKQTTNRRQDINRRLVSMRRQNGEVDRGRLTMFDLIYYNPTTNPIVLDDEEIKVREANKREEEKRSKLSSSDEEGVDDPDEQEEKAAPVAQLKLGPNGEIMLDEQSLVVKRSEKRRLSKTVVHEAGWEGGGGGGRYSRTARTATWSPEETVRFYRALAAIGTDFSLIATLFPSRTRRDLKVKFKKEERQNGALVEKALRCRSAWDAARMQAEFAAEREREAGARAAAEREGRSARERAERDRARHRGLKRSLGAKAVECDVTSFCTRGFSNPDEIIQFVEENKKARKRGRPRKNPVAEKNPEPQVSDTAPSTQTVSPKTPTNNDRLKSVQVITPPVLPANLENGSLVVLQTTHPQSSEKIVKTYMKKSDGTLIPVTLPSVKLSNVMNYIKTGVKVAGSPGNHAGSQTCSPVAEVAT